MPASRTSRGVSLTLARCCLVAGLFYCAYVEARQGAAAWYMRSGSFRALEQALKYDSADPELQDAFGTFLHLYGAALSPDLVVDFYGRAVNGSPQNAQYWADLGAAYDWAGRPAEAASAFQRARELFPNSPDIQWRIANFAVRQGNTGQALEALRKVLFSGGIRREEVFQLANRASADQNRILHDVVPGEADELLDYLRFAIKRGDLDGAQMAWRRIIEVNLPFAARDAFPYLDALIQAQRSAELLRTWSDLRMRFPGQISARANDNLVINGSFEREPLNGGLDWRILPLAGVRVTHDRAVGMAGAQSLRIDFDGSENPYYCHVYQYVPVQPATVYRFSGALRAREISSDSGPTFEVYDAADMHRLFLTGRSVTGNSGWELQQFRFKTTADTRLLVVRVARRPSEKIANRISGTVWVSTVLLEEEGPDRKKPGTGESAATIRR
jgi:tetratricopeptide (TPR) repeat protein